VTRSSASRMACHSRFPSLRLNLVVPSSSKSSFGPAEHQTPLHPRTEVIRLQSELGRKFDRVEDKVSAAVADDVHALFPFGYLLLESGRDRDHLFNVSSAPLIVRSAERS
jgi:hypothetical protein